MTSVTPSTLGPLNPGNVVSAALKLYRDNFKAYFGLSLRASLWLLVPVYGWAKSLMYWAMIGRLAYRTLLNQPESRQAAYRDMNPQLWSFLGLGLLAAVVLSGAYLGLTLACGIAAAMIGGVAGAVFSAIFSSEIGTVLGIALGVVAFIPMLLFGLAWIASRLIVAELPLALNMNPSAAESLKRSWELTQQSVIRIQFVCVAAVLVTLPALIMLSYAPQVPLAFLAPSSPLYWLFYTLSTVLSLGANAFVTPFWQAIKGVLYYDLCSRREGMDLIR